jgi:hypothetical protein
VIRLTASSLVGEGSSSRRVTSFPFVAADVGGKTVTALVVDASGVRAVEAALRHLGARRYDDHVELIEQAIIRPYGSAASILEPLAEATAVLCDWSTAERAQALWRVIEEGVRDRHVSTAKSRERHALQAAFRLPDDDVAVKWGASLTERFKQLGSLPVFGNLTSTQPMEISWKRGVERLADHLHERFRELKTPEDWAHYKPTWTVRPDQESDRTAFRTPSEGAQKLVVNLVVLTVLMHGRSPYRRISERWITSHDEDGLKYYRSWAFFTGIHLEDRIYTPTRAIWGCRAEQIDEDGLPVTRLWFPRPLKPGEQAHFMTEVVDEDPKGDDPRGWVNVYVDHYGIEPGELRNGVLPVSGLTIRVKFDGNALPSAVWWYAEQNERERYRQPPVDSPRRLPVVSGQVVKTFEQPCQPRESYGVAFTWNREPDGRPW